MTVEPLVLRYAARSDVGLVRAKNDDSAYVGQYLAVVADGMGGHAGGDVASASTVLDLIHLDHGDHGSDAGSHLADEIQTANSLLSELVHVNPKLAGMGTTVTALLLSGQRLAYAHIGDSRAYRLKDGDFAQMSTDHTFVQRMIDEGRMTEAEAEVHPHKNVLMRVLGDVDASPELDLKYFDVEVGERWLLCSDGLNFVRPEMIEEVVRHTKNLATAAQTLIELTLAAGSPDNVTVVIVDVAAATDEDRQALEKMVLAAYDEDGDPVVDADEATDTTDEATAPLTMAHAPLEEEVSPELTPLENVYGTETAVMVDTPTDVPESKQSTDPDAIAADPAAELDANIRAAAVKYELSLRPHELVGAAVTATAEGKIPLLARRPDSQRAAQLLTHRTLDVTTAVEAEDSLPRARFRPLVLTILSSIVVLVLVTGGWAAYAWTQTQYYVGVSNGNVAIFHGVSQNLGPISLSSLQQETPIPVTGLPAYSQQLVTQTMPAASLAGAEQLIIDLQLGTGSSIPPCDLPALMPTPSATGSSAPADATTAGSPPATGAAAAPAESPAPLIPPTTGPAADAASAAAPTVAGGATDDATSAPAPTCLPGAVE